MIRGLQITIRGEELSHRIAERIRTHEAATSALETRIRRRDGDQSFDVRPEDGFKTLGELEHERQHHQDRGLQLTLLRDNLVAGELYLLNGADLRQAELISTDLAASSGSPDNTCIGDRTSAPIDGLKLTIPGGELRRLLDERMRDHRRRADWWKREQARTPEQQTEEDPLLPDHTCANEAERHNWRGDVLGFIRDHIDSAELYRLGEGDLAFGELLPEKPDWMEQEEYEERGRVGFQLERLTKSVGALAPNEFALPNESTGVRLRE